MVAPGETRARGEETQSRLSVMVAQREEFQPFNMTECSSLAQAVNRLAWMYRFVNNCRLHKSKRVIGPLIPDERIKSLRFLSDLRSSEPTRVR